MQTLTADDIIEEAAIQAGKTLPLDDYDFRFGEGLFRSLDYIHEYMRTDTKTQQNKKPFSEWISEWKEIADDLRYEDANNA